MLIDWFTVVAQAINFLILVWLMKRYLYQPILKALDAREQRIAAELADADAKKAEAQAAREEFRRKNEAFDSQRAGLLSKASNDAAAEHSRLLDEVRKDADDLRGKLQDKLGNEFRNCTMRSRAGHRPKCSQSRARPCPSFPGLPWKRAWPRCSSSACAN